MIEALHDVILKGHVFVYLDDIIIHSPNVEEHIKTLNEVFLALEKVNLAIKPSKCKLFRKSIKYLGHMVDENGCKPLETSVEAIQKLVRPTTIKGVRSFLGSLNFYRKFIMDFADIAAPLYEFLKKKNTVIKWNEDAELAFQTLKLKLTSAPLLAFPQYDKPFVIKTDASLSAIGAVLEQKNIYGEFQPIAYASRRLNKAEKNYAVIEREALAIVFALDHFKHLTYGNKILLLTDHKPLIYLNELKDTNSRVARWMINIQQNDIEFEYIPGKFNNLADLLSRSPEEEVTSMCTVEITRKPLTIELVREHQLADTFCNDLISKIKDGTMQDDSWILDDENILLKKVQLGKCNFYAYRTFIPDSLISEVLYFYHDHISGGHFSLEKTIHRVKRSFTWDNMFKNIKDYINSCEKCQRRHRSRMKAPIQAVSPPTGCMSKLSIDILGPFSTTQRRNKYIITYTDHFSRMTFASPLVSQEAHVIAKDYMETIYTRYGGSRYILSDRGPQLVGHIMTTLCNKLGIERICTGAYWPRSNGVSERINSKILNMISHYCNSKFTDWDLKLPYLMQTINNTVHKSTNQIPFYVFHGFHQYDVFSDFNIDENDDNLDRVDLVDQIMERLESARSEVFANLETSSINNAKSKDKGRNLRIFNIGDNVLALDVASYSGHNRKLNPRYTGPFSVIRRTGLANYHIQNINKPDIIKKVHVDKLKPYFARSNLVDDEELDAVATIQDNIRPKTAMQIDILPYFTFPDEDQSDSESGQLMVGSDLSQMEIVEYENFLKSLKNANMVREKGDQTIPKQLEMDLDDLGNDGIGQTEEVECPAVKHNYFLRSTVPK